MRILVVEDDAEVARQVATALRTVRSAVDVSADGPDALFRGETEHLYEQDFDRDSNVIEVLVNRLRKKLGASLIVTRRGQGYQLSEPDDAP